MVTTAVMSGPTRLIAGPGSLTRLADEIRRTGGSRVLLVSDSNLAQIGLLDRVSEVIEAAGLVHGRFHDVHVADGVDAYSAMSADIVVGVGRGSSLDLAKLIRWKVGGSFEDRTSAVPLIAIPTSAGSGSEVRNTATTERVPFTHARLAANTAILDAELTVGLSPLETALGGLDALARALEAYVAKASHPIADALAIAALARLGSFLKIAVADGAHVRARHELLLASSMAGLAAEKGLGATHSLAHALSSAARMAHGTANAVMLPHVMAFNLEVAADRYAVAGAAIGVERVGSDADRGRAFVDWVVRLREELGVESRLESYGVTEEMVESMAPRAVADRNHQDNPKPLALDDARALYKAAL